MGPLDYYNSMQAQAGLLPPQVIFPGQISAAIANQGGVGAFGTMYPTQTYQTALGSPPIFQGPTGVMAPMNPGAPYNPYAPSNPFGGVPAYGGFHGSQGPYTPYAPNPPPAYGGFQGQNAVPFAPPPPSPSFDTAYGGAVAQRQADADRSFVMGQGAGGVGARLAANAAVGATGAYMGRRAGPWGMAVGAAVGFLGSEISGFGGGVQNLHGNYVQGPRLAEYGMATGIEHVSRGFVNDGPYLNPSGQGFSHAASHAAAHGLTEMASSADFRRETRDRFNSQDLGRITQLSGQSGMLSGASSPEEMTTRVREVAKSLSAFMELAREPDVVRAIQTMGSLRASGLNLNETMQAVSQGRSFARMAGSSFQGLAEVGGAMGSQTFQSMGLTQGLGFQSGMGNYAGAAASINRGTLNAQLSSLAGGASGLGTLNTMYSASALQHPMTVPGLMNSSGALDANAVRGYLGGQHDVFSLTGRGSTNLQGMTGRMGSEGLGMAIAMQPLLQDSLGRMIQSQGPFSGRNLEDRQVMALSRRMNMSGAAGFLTAAQTMGMDRTQAVTRATELGSQRYWRGQRQQLNIDRHEARANSDREREEGEPGFFETLSHETALGSELSGIGDSFHHAGLSVSRFFGGAESQTFRGGPVSEDALFRSSRRVRSDAFGAYQRSLASRARAREEGPGRFSAARMVRDEYNTMEARGMRGAGAVFGMVMEGALGGASATDREVERLNLAAGGRFATTVRSATSDDRRSAMANVDMVFGGAGAAGEYAERLSAQTRNQSTTGRSIANGLVRAASFGLTAGMADSGNIFGAAPVTGQFEAYRATMRRRGWNDDRIAETWRTHEHDIAGTVSTFQRATGMSGTERASWDATASNSDRWRGGGAYMSGARADAAQAGTRLMGHTSLDAQESLSGALDSTTGLGRAGTANNDLSRRMIVALAAANVAKNGDESRYGRQAGAVSTAMAQQARAAGLDFSAIADRSAALATRMRGNHGFQEAAQGILNKDATPGSMISRLGAYETGMQDPQLAQNVAYGTQMLGSSGGVLSTVLGGLDSSTYDPDEVRRRLAGMTPEQLRRLRGERGGSRIAGMIGQLNSGDARTSGNAMRGITGALNELGQHGTDLQRRWEQENSLTNRFAPEMLRNAMRDHWVGDQMKASSSGERGALGGLLDSVGSQSEAQGSGLGGASDTLRDAAQMLKEAAENLNGASTNGGLDRLVSPT